MNARDIGQLASLARTALDADLALELEDELRQAIGDARDMRARCSRAAFRLAGGIGI